MAHPYRYLIVYCEDRIISISQPYMQPIIRGKQGQITEFGATVGGAEMP